MRFHFLFSPSDARTGSAAAMAVAYTTDGRYRLRAANPRKPVWGEKRNNSPTVRQKHT